MQGEIALKDIAACPVPTERKPASFKDVWRVVRALGAPYWVKAGGISIGAAIVLGLTTRLIPNPFFIRMIPTTAIDYVIFVISVAFVGRTWALPADTTKPGDEPRSLIGGLGAFLAVGCPTCNKLVLLLLGSGGALTYFAPLQPILG